MLQKNFSYEKSLYVFVSKLIHITTKETANHIINHIFVLLNVINFNHFHLKGYQKSFLLKTPPAFIPFILL